MRNQRQQRALGQRIDLVEHEQHGAVELLDQLQSEVVLGLGKRHLVLAHRPHLAGLGEFFAGMQLGRYGQAMRHVDEEQHRVARLERIVDLLHHAAVELGFGLVHAGCIDHDDLRLRAAGIALGLFPRRQLQDALDARPRRLRLVRDDGQLLAQQRIQQRRLTRIRTPHDRYKSTTQCHLSRMTHSGKTVRSEE
jgi:hypothetical protein